MFELKPTITEQCAVELIRKCQQEAEKAIQDGNVPIACIITDFNGQIIVQAHNTQNTDLDPTAHAEINALRQLGKQLGTRYLDGHVIFSNAESCSMCASACIKAHIYNFYYGASAEPSMDPWVTIQDIAKVSRNPLKIVGPILGEECASQIADGRAKIS